MQNINMSVKGSALTITVDLSKRLGKSKSGKTGVSERNPAADSARLRFLCGLLTGLYRTLLGYLVTPDTVTQWQRVCCLKPSTLCTDDRYVPVHTAHVHLGVSH